jgi:hypothetical protein
VFYPAFLEAAEAKGDRQLFFRATEDHHAADIVLAELAATGPDSEHFLAKIQLLDELLGGHLEREEKTMFPHARRLIDREDMAEVGERMQARRASLEAQWNNKLLRPAKRVQSVVESFAPSRMKSVKAAALSRVMPISRRGSERAAAKQKSGGRAAGRKR